MITSLIGIEENQASSQQMCSLLRRLKDRVFSIAETFDSVNVSVKDAAGSGILLSKALAEQLGGTFRCERNDRTVFVLEVPLPG